MTARIVFGLVLSGLIGLVGCSRPPAEGGKQSGTRPAIPEDPLQIAVDTLSRATTLGDFKEALHLVNKHLNKPENEDALQLSKDDRQALARFSLEKDELEAVETRAFRPLDAHYLEECFVVGDAARAVDQPDLDSVERARLALAWVDRQVLLREGSGDMMPPLYVLRAGQGATRERALVFLALLRQFRIPACVLLWPEPERGKQGLLLVGVLGSRGEQPDIFLFDPRLGQPVPGPEGIATLAQLRKNPNLVAPVGGKSDSVPEVLLACPLSALSPRMKYLEDKLGRSDRVVLALAPAQLLEQVKSAAGEVKVWDLPLRLLAANLPESEGGTDKNARLGMFSAKQIPMLALARNFATMRLIGEDMPVKQAQMMLLNFGQQLFVKYAREPHAQLIKGQNDQAIKRLQIIHSAFVDMEFSPLPEFVKRINDWRDTIIRHQLAVIRQQRGAKEAAEALWNRDQYLLALLQGESPNQQKHAKEELSYIVLTAVKDTLEEQTLYMLAEALHEKAERNQATWERLKKTGKAESQVRRAADRVQESWSNTRDWWKKYADRHSLAWSSFEPRFRAIQFSWQRREPERREQEQALSLWDQFVSEIHRAAAARMFLARAFQNLGQAQDAMSSLAVLQKDLTALLDNTEIKEELASQLEKVRGQRNTIQTAILEDLARDLGADGGLTWLRKKAQGQLQQLQSKK